jgi:2'-5' RNA ligase
MYRLFMAVDLPEEVKEAVAGTCTGLPGVKWIHMSQLHLTLRFIGNADDELFSRIKNELAGIADGPFPIALRGVGCFPPRRDPRVLWVGVEPNPELVRLAEKVEEAVVRAGVVPETRSFSPHITTARISGFTRAKISEYIARLGTFAAGQFEIGEFYLYSSTLTPKGAVHKREAAYPLLHHRT